MTPSNETTEAEVLQAIRDAVCNKDECKHIFDEEFRNSIACSRCGLDKICWDGKDDCWNRDLGLADVFIAWKKKTGLLCNPTDTWLSESNGTYCLHFTENPSVFYDLTKKAHEQKPVFYQFMHSLLIST